MLLLGMRSLPGLRKTACPAMRFWQIISCPSLRSDGIDDYPEFLHTTDVYGTLHDFCWRAAARPVCPVLPCAPCDDRGGAGVRRVPGFPPEMRYAVYCVYLNLGCQLFRHSCGRPDGPQRQLHSCWYCWAAEGMDCFFRENG